VPHLELQHLDRDIIGGTTFHGGGDEFFGNGLRVSSRRVQHFRDLFVRQTATPASDFVLEQTIGSAQYPSVFLRDLFKSAIWFRVQTKSRPIIGILLSDTFELPEVFKKESPNALESAKTPPTLHVPFVNSTIDFLKFGFPLSILFLSFSSSGMWSTESCTAFPSLINKTLASPTFAVHNLLPSTIAAKAKVLPHLAPPMPRSPKDAPKTFRGRDAHFHRTLCNSPTTPPTEIYLDSYSL
jgi:hypothetical protein